MKKQQVLIIGGGTTFDRYGDYLEYLKSKEIDLDRIKPAIDWKFTIGEDLGPDYEVFVPQMPNKQNAKYKEWSVWFENILSVLNEELIIIGHSLGGIFLAKYLLSQNINKKIVKLILIAAPLTDTPAESLGSFRINNPGKLIKLEQLTNSIELIYSKDDFVVPFNDGMQYKKLLPNSRLHVFDAKGHFNMEYLPELVKIIDKNVV